MGSLKVVEPTVKWDDGLRLWLKRYIEEHPHHNTDVLSRDQYTGISKPALDAYLDGTYFLPKGAGGKGVDPRRSNVEERIRAYKLKVEGGRRGKPFAETQTWWHIVMACETAIKEDSIVVVHGRPGIGKSRCLHEFCLRKMTTDPIYVLCSKNIKTRYFAQKIARAVKVSDKTSIAEMEDNIAAKLRKNKRPIFIDQANYLSEWGLGTVCHIWEVAQVPVVLFGTHNLYEMFFTSRMTEEVREQLARRVQIFYGLPGLTNEEGYAIIKRALGKYATDQLCAQIMSQTGGLYDGVQKALPRILELQEQADHLKPEEIVATACAKLAIA